MSVSITGFLIITTFNIIMPIFPLFLSSLGATAAVIGLIFGARYVGQIFLRAPFGSISDRLGRKSLIEAGCICIVISQFTFFVAQDLLVIFGASILNSIGLALFWPVLQASVSDLSRSGKVAERFAIYSTITDVGTIIGPLFGGWFAELYGYRLVLGISTLSATISLLFSFLLIPDTFRNGDKKGNSAKGVRKEFIQSIRLLPVTALSMLRKPMILMIAGATFAEFFFFSALAAYYPLLARAEGLNEVEIGITITSFGLLSVPLRLFMGRFSDRTGRIIPIILSLSSYTVLIALIPLFPAFAWLTFFIALLGIFDGLIFVNSIAAITETMGGEKRGLGTGFWGVVAYTGYSAAAVLMGFIAEISLSWVFYLTSAICFSILLLVLFISSRTKFS